MLRTGVRTPATRQPAAAGRRHPGTFSGVDDSQVLTRVASVLERRQGTMVQVLVPGTGTVHALDGVAAVVWAGLVRPGTRADLLEALVDAADLVQADQASALLDEALALLTTAGLVVPAEPAVGAGSVAPVTGRASST